MRTGCSQTSATGMYPQGSVPGKGVYGAATGFRTPSPQSRRATAFHKRFFACGKTALVPSPALKPLPQNRSYRALWDSIRVMKVSSSTTSIPSDSALRSFEPAASPASTTDVLAETLPVTRAPNDSSIDFARALGMPSAPVSTQVWPARGCSPWLTSTACQRSPAASRSCRTCRLCGSRKKA